MPTKIAPSTNLIPGPEELLEYLPPYKVLVCRSCKYAIQTKAIARHLKEIHGLKSSDRRPYLQYSQQFKLAEPELVVEYKPIDFPVQSLPVQDGLQCQASNCGHLCVTEKRMKQHWLAVHGRSGVAKRDWQMAPLQTFFKGNLLRYFTGSQSESHIGKPHTTVREDSTTERAVS